MLPQKSYLAAAKRLRSYALSLERLSSPATPRELAALTRSIHGLSLFGQSFSAKHRRAGLAKVREVARAKL